VAAAQFGGQRQGRRARRVPAVVAHRHDRLVGGADDLAARVATEAPRRDRPAPRPHTFLVAAGGRLHDFHTVAEPQVAARVGLDRGAGAQPRDRGERGRREVRTLRDPQAVVLRRHVVDA